MLWWKTETPGNSVGAVRASVCSPMLCPLCSSFAFRFPHLNVGIVLFCLIVRMFMRDTVYERLDSSLWSSPPYLLWFHLSPVKRDLWFSFCWTGGTELGLVSLCWWDLWRSAATGSGNFRLWIPYSAPSLLCSCSGLRQQLWGANVEQVFWLPKPFTPCSLFIFLKSSSAIFFCPRGLFLWYLRNSINHICDATEIRKKYYWKMGKLFGFFGSGFCFLFCIVLVFF